MTAIHEWLANHDDNLSEIARRVDTASEVVYLAAVLVLAGFSDEQIRDQLSVLEVRLRDGHDSLTGLLSALAQIRDLAGSPASLSG